MKNNFFKLPNRTIQDLIQTIKNLIICIKFQTGTKFRSVYYKYNKSTYIK